jgi:predicted RNA binding protein YcfA (HicA-like mRNA interferase family)
MVGILCQDGRRRSIIGTGQNPWLALARELDWDRAALRLNGGRRHRREFVDLIMLLEQAGWVPRNSHPERGGHISVPHPKKDLGAGLVNKVMKQAGLK